MFRLFYSVEHFLFQCKCFNQLNNSWIQCRSQSTTSMASSLLEEMCPDAMPVQIQEAMSASGGDANQAADALHIYTYTRKKNFIIIS